MKKVWLMVGFAGLCFAVGVKGQGRYEEKDYVLFTPQGEVKVCEAVGAPSLGVSVGDLLELVFRPDEIPNYYCTGTRISLNIGGYLTRLMRDWLHEEHKVRGKISPFYGVWVELFVYRDIDEAKKTFYRWSHSHMPEKPRLGSFSGMPIGEECVNYSFPSLEIMFRVGRVIAHVAGQLKNAPKEDNAYFTEALGIGIEYLLRQHLKVGALPSKIRLLLAGQPNGEVVLLKDTAVGECRLLKDAGVQVKEHRDSKEWSVRLERNGRWVKVKAFGWEMETENGKVKLDRPVFPYKGELIVPLRQVAQALGLKVQQKDQTIALMAK